MYKHLLIATDGSQLSYKALQEGLELSRILGAAVTIITVTQPIHAVFPGEMGLGVSLAGYDAWARQHAKEVLEEVHKIVMQASVKVDTRHVTDAYAAEAIIDTANEVGADLIVMASHGRRGIERLLLGSETARVLAGSPKPVLVVR